MITVARISFMDVREQPELLAEYAAEFSIAGRPPINPQWAMYEALEASGGYQGFAAYVDGKMVGFAGLLTMVNPHCSVMMATVESLFVRKAHRGVLTFARLMEAIESHAAGKGCVEILYSALAGSALEAVLGKRCARTNSIFCKPLRRHTSAFGGYLGR